MSINDHARNTLASNGYQLARARFTKVCHRLGVECVSYLHPLAGPDGEPLSIDVAHIGSERAKKTLLLISGTHGPELFVGSDCQINWLENHRTELPDDVSVLLVHGINPWGSAYSRRFNENNIDVNRNFIDFSKELPKNQHYDTLYEALSCGTFDAIIAGNANQLIEEFCSEHGMSALMVTLMQGQYTHPDGFGFGGVEPCWSHLRLMEILDAYAMNKDAVALIDFHSGLGPFGYGIPIALHAKGSDALERSKEWYGQSLEALRENKTLPYDVSGDLCTGVEKKLAGVKFTGIALEFGAYNEQRTLNALRSQYRLEHCEDVAVVEGVEREINTVFYPATADWNGMIFPRSVQVIQQAIAGLALGVVV